MSYSPTEEVMAAGPPVTISRIHTRQLNGHSSADQYCSLSRSNSSAQSSHQSGISLQQLSPQGQQKNNVNNKEITVEQNTPPQRPSPRHQESFDINGWPEGIEKPTKFLGMKVKPISQWSIKHIFCLSY